MPWSTAEFRRKWRKVAKQAGVPDNVTNRDSCPAGMIRGGPDRAKVSQKYTLKRLDYSVRMARRMYPRWADIDGHRQIDAIDPKQKSFAWPASAANRLL
ncbi:hypothetical protein [Bradyrhizobium sp. Ash2021]|uniref:hypothetical protein n=1 Tax=Bradyrhizobium sp. Ash2021 TaxID=2954771 RepID=UPI002815BCD8|nr:hypothetical protein [Bradyrhizobium sp. Ash2021]WMT77096.1 hypothetical protein NL528_12440 [Bradyrhizobium sp. Ash2021]